VIVHPPYTNPEIALGTAVYGEAKSVHVTLRVVAPVSSHVMSAIPSTICMVDAILLIVGRGTDADFLPFALPRGELMGIKLHGATTLFENDAKKSSGRNTLGTNGDKCVICLPPAVFLRESIAAYFLNCVN
jgi:hypothetical protein